MPNDIKKKLGLQFSDPTQEALTNALGEKLRRVPDDDELIAQSKQHSMSVQALVKAYLAKDMPYLAMMAIRNAEGQCDE